ncbi:uncharacterized protein METZ01_LOCUS385552 [marine metagenome]|uniref:Uncharacterized protein n=1 Tax=marine metagenome TaxID=408172 RepID=A0A382UG68_9ZZZZ
MQDEGKIKLLLDDAVLKKRRPSMKSPMLGGAGV